MKKILSIFLAVLMLCQCFTVIDVFASEGDVVAAPTKLLFDADVEKLVGYNVPAGIGGGIQFKLYPDNGAETSVWAGNDNTYFYQASTYAKNLKNGTYADSNGLSLNYFVASNAVNGPWGVLDNSSNDVYGNFPDKTTFELTFLDKSNEDNKRASGKGYILRFFGHHPYDDVFYYAGPNGTSTANYMYPSSNSETKFGEANRWIDFKVETIENNDVKTRSAFWKYHEEDDTAWRNIENKVETNNNVYAVIVGQMSDDTSDKAEILIHDFKATRTYRPVISNVTVDGTAIESGATGISCGAKEITVTFDQTMAAGMEGKIKLTAVGGSDADITVTTQDDRTYTIAINGELSGDTKYKLDLSECESLHDLIAEEEFTFETGASPVITVTAQGDVSAIDWKQSNTISVDFSAPVDPSTVNENSVKLCYADGTPAGDVPMIIEAAPSGAEITVGQLEAWRDYKLVFSNTIEPANAENKFNGCEVYFGTDHADVFEYDYNKVGSINGKVISDAAQTTLASTYESTDSDTGIKYVTKTNDNSAGTDSKDEIVYIKAPSPANSSDIVMSYNLRVSKKTEGSVILAASGWVSSLANGAGAYIGADTIGFAGTGAQNLTNDGKFHDYKFNMALSADASQRNTTGYLLTKDGWELRGPSRPYNKSTSTTETLQILKYAAYAGKVNGPIDIARVVVSTSPKADVMKSYVDYQTREITVSLGKNMAVGNEDKIAVKIGDTTVDSTVTQINSNTYTIKLDEVIQPNTAYTIDMSSLVCADGVIGTQSYTLTTPAAAIETPVFAINGNAGSVQVKNNTGSPLKYTVIVAVYDKGNMLKAVETVTNTILDGATSETHTVTADLSQYASADKTGWTSKLMIWKGDITAATPIHTAADGTIQ